MPIRVLVLTTTFPDTPGDGTPAFVADLAMSLAARDDFEVTVVAPSNGTARIMDQFPGITVVRFRYGPRRLETFATKAIMPEIRANPAKTLLIPGFIFNLWFTAYKESRRFPYDVVHAHWIIPSGLAAGTLGTRYVVTVHGTDAHALSGPLFQRLKRWAANRASRVLPVSPSLLRLLEDQGIEASSPIPMGISTDELQSSGTVRKSHNVVFVGRLAENKGAHILLQALTYIPDAVATIVGDGPERGSLERLAEDLQLSERVRFKGKLARPAVIAELHSGSVFVAPSLRTSRGDAEGFSQVVAEAMAAGIPVVCSDICGVAAYLVDGFDALIVPQNNVGGLVTALQATFCAPEAAQARAKNALITARREFSLSSTTEKYADLLREVSSATSARSAL